MVAYSATKGSMYVRVFASVLAQIVVPFHEFRGAGFEETEGMRL